MADEKTHQPGVNGYPEIGYKLTRNGLAVNISVKAESSKQAEQLFWKILKHVEDANP